MLSEYLHKCSPAFIIDHLQPNLYVLAVGGGSGHPPSSFEVLCYEQRATTISNLNAAVPITPAYLQARHPSHGSEEARQLSP